MGLSLAPARASLAGGTRCGARGPGRRRLAALVSALDREVVAAPLATTPRWDPLAPGSPVQPWYRWGS